MYFIINRQNPSHASEDFKFIITHVDLTAYMKARTKTCVESTRPMTRKTTNDTQLVLTKNFPCQERHKMSENVTLLVITKPHVLQHRQKSKTSVDQTLPMPARIQNAP